LRSLILVSLDNIEALWELQEQVRYSYILKYLKEHVVNHELDYISKMLTYIFMYKIKCIGYLIL